MRLSLCLLTAYRSSQEKPAPREGGGSSKDKAHRQALLSDEPMPHSADKLWDRSKGCCYGLKQLRLICREQSKCLGNGFMQKSGFWKKGWNMKCVKEKISKWLPLRSTIGSLQYHSIEILPQVNALLLWLALFFNHTIVPATAVCTGMHQILSVIWIICLPSVAPSKGPKEHN